MSKDPCRPHTGNTQWSMWVCLLTWDCLLHYNFHNMAYKKMFNLIKWGVELKMNWLNWSIPISSGFQFQFNSNSKSFNSIPIQFMLNWIELIINSNSIHELIRALIGTSLSLQKDSSSTGSEVLSRVGVKYFSKYLSQVQVLFSYLQVQVQVQVLRVLGRHQVHQVLFQSSTSQVQVLW